jgi:hypothetical protein
MLKKRYVAVFLVPDWGMKPAMASGCCTGPTSYIRVGWQDNDSLLSYEYYGVVHFDIFLSKMNGLSDNRLCKYTKK